ncbi:MAG: hypothetical protein AB1345_11345 [Chloroflexota bacterium]
MTKQPKNSNKLPEGKRGERYRRQVAGLMLGAGVGMVLAWLVPSWDYFTVVIWGAVIGGILSSAAQFERAGAALTHGENHRLNLAVGLGIPFTLLIIIWTLIRFL